MWSRRYVHGRLVDYPLHVPFLEALFGIFRHSYLSCRGGEQNHAKEGPHEDIIYLLKVNSAGAQMLAVDDMFLRYRKDSE